MPTSAPMSAIDTELNPLRESNRSAARRIVSRRWGSLVRTRAGCFWRAAAVVSIEGSLRA
ncbi:hypothetical protein ACFFX0_16565 [Citricoccus parietis]|uniref:Uncharacterized protein n=1 Tax=Citricoccus parietis TaxID=592307 RepID=A0ABV5G1E1_9MICC